MKKRAVFLVLSIVLLAFFIIGCMSVMLAPESESVSADSGVEDAFDYSAVPAYCGDAYVVVNRNVPFFRQTEITDESFEEFTELDGLNRCGVVWACIGRDLMPTEERGSIGSVKPTGWQTVRYDGMVDGNYLYNRCHLIGFRLSGENANELNLITGTRYLNIEGMLPFEDMVADYVKETGNHVMYRVTPVFEGANLLASGVLMEGWSVEDNGEGICFCVFAYNVQPGIEIDYATGESSLAEDDSGEGDEAVRFIGNKNSMVFHNPTCNGLPAEQNRIYFDSREEALEKGFKACGRCEP